jgi:hypothetical protein
MTAIGYVECKDAFAMSVVQSVNEAKFSMEVRTIKQADYISVKFSI